jgi:cyclopropane-fatty-acyl-phospholipid synthase
VTLSEEQLSLARQRVIREGLTDRIRLELRDYRDLDGSFDAIVSVEMVEAVGLEFLPAYFRALQRCTAPHGRIALQAITLPHDRAIATASTYTWIHKYIFPGGALPSIQLLREHGAAAGLRLIDDLAIGDSYAATLRLWGDRFARNADRLAAAGFDELFARTWMFYLRYCEGGFRAGYLDVHQLTYTREGNP